MLSLSFTFGNVLFVYIYLFIYLFFFFFQDEAGNKLEKSSMRLEKLLSAKTFNLPHCQIR